MTKKILDENYTRIKPKYFFFLKKMKPETIEKYKIKWDSKRNEYISLIDSNY